MHSGDGRDPLTVPHTDVRPGFEHGRPEPVPGVALSVEAQQLLGMLGGKRLDLRELRVLFGREIREPHLQHGPVGLQFVVATQRLRNARSQVQVEARRESVRDGRGEFGEARVALRPEREEHRRVLAGVEERHGRERPALLQPEPPRVGPEGVIEVAQSVQVQERVLT